VTPGSVLLGSVKTNIGHTDTAAGVAGLIKAVLALEHRTVPATLHFTRPNPAIDFAAGPFTVNTERRDWEASAFPRRAGVSSFGIGGTNAHVVLEEAPQTPLPAEPTGRSRLLLLSARSPEALAAAGRRLAQHLLRHPELSLAEVACTLQLGRHAFAHRRYLVCADHTGAVTALIAPAAAAAPAADRALPQDPDALLDLLRADQPDQVLPDEERAAVLDALGRLWQQGAPVDWTRLYAGARPRRVPLPTYPFERRTHLVRPEPFARDQRTAAAAESDDRALIGDSAAPEAVEDRLMVLFGKVLGSGDGLDERDFFDLGGDSLSAVQLLSLVEDEFGVSPPLEAVFDAPTVREFAVVIVDQLALLHATETDSEARGKA
jgi:acyl transferase domain-containing protein/acyl carrier protein